MKISVIIPIYKVEKYLRQCVDSVLNQTYRDLEVILVDDGSPDECPKICDEYALQDQRVIVVHKPNGGLSDARNKGVEQATGDYGVFLDSDDYWDCDTALAQLVKRISDTNADVLSFAYYKLDESTGKRSFFAENEPSLPVDISEKQARLDYLAEHGLISASACNKLVRKEILRRLPFEIGKLSEDIEWTSKLICQDVLFDFINLPFYCYRQREGSISQSISSASCDNLRSAIIGCCIIANNTSAVTEDCVKTYAAYQFSTFIAVQALAEIFQKSNIRQLARYKGILKHYGNDRKVKYMYYGTRIFGLRLWCRIIRATKTLWNNRRDSI